MCYYNKCETADTVEWHQQLKRNERQKSSDLNNKTFFSKRESHWGGMMWQILSLPWENVEQDDYI